MEQNIEHEPINIEKILREQVIFLSTLIEQIYETKPERRANEYDENISKCIFDLQHEILQYTQSRQRHLIDCCEDLKNKLRICRQKDQQQLQRILSCAVF